MDLNRFIYWYETRGLSFVPIYMSCIAGILTIESKSEELK